MKLQILIFTVFLFSCLSLVGAMEMDNSLSYSDGDKTVTIDNAFGLGRTIGKAELLTPLVNHEVIIGEDKIVMEYRFFEFEEYEEAFGDVRFTDMNTGKDIEKDYHFEQIVYEEYQSPTYVPDCTQRVASGSCGQKLIGWETFSKRIRIPYTSRKLEGEITLALVTDVEDGDSIDGKWKVAGKYIERHAIWNSTFDFRLEHYYKLDETTAATVALDEIVGNNLTFTSGNMQAGGVINNMANHTAAGNLNATTFTNISLAVNGTANKTFNFWAHTRNGQGVDQDYMSLGPSTAGRLQIGTVASGTKRYLVEDGLTSFVSTLPVMNGMHMHTIIINTTTMTYYINGTSIGQLIHPYDTINTILSVGSRLQGQPNLFNGSMDEIGIWSRALSPSEVTDLYGGGAGLEFGGSIVLTVNLESPPDNLDINADELFFAGNYSLTGSGNLTNATLFVWNPDNSIFGTNATNITGTVNETNLSLSGFNIADGYNWNYFVCGANATLSATICNFANSNRSFNIQPFNTGTSMFNHTPFETESQRFELNISILTSVLSVSSILNYNGTAHLATSECSGVACTIFTTIDIPLIDGSVESQNKSFFWNVTTFNGTASISSALATNQQNVTRIHLDECGAANTQQTLNFSGFQEASGDRINPFYVAGTFQSWLGTGTTRRESIFSNLTTDELDLCIFPTNRNFKTEADIEYNEVQNGTTYDTRNYYFQNDTINNFTQHIPLFLLEASDATSFILKVQDTNLLPVANALIEIFRFDPGTGNSTIVQIAKTDDNGQTVGFFKTETVDYSFVIKRQGVTLLTTSNQKVIPETAPFTLTFTVGEEVGIPWENFDPLEDLTQTLIFNSSSAFVVFTYSDTSGNFSLGRLTVVSENLTGFSPVVCNVTSSQASAVLLCDTGNISSTYIATAHITRDSVISLVNQIKFSIQSFASVVGLLGVFMAWFIILVSAFAFKFNEIAGIALMNGAVIMVNLIGLVDFGYVFIFGMIGVSIIIITQLER